MMMPSISSSNTTTTTTTTSDLFPFDPTNLNNSSIAWRRHLDEKGYVVLTDVVPNPQQHFHQLFSDLALLGTGINPYDPSTLTTKHMPGYVNVGIIKDPKAGMAHSRFMWDARVACKPVFQQLYGITTTTTTTDDSTTTTNNGGGSSGLITSFDTAGVFTNYHLPEIGHKSKTKPAWYHVDQGHLALGLGRQCIQGALNLLDANRSTGGFVVCPGSHLALEDTLRVAGSKRRSNFVQLGSNNPKDDIAGFKALLGKYPPILVEAPAGSMILWDSRTIHANSHHLSPTPIAPNPNFPGVLRAMAYLCMMPRDRLYDPNNPDHYTTNAMLRRDYVNNGSITNHWPIVLKDHNKFKGPMAKEHMRYPRHKSLFPLTGTAALSPTTIFSNPAYNDLI